MKSVCFPSTIWFQSRQYPKHDQFLESATLSLPPRRQALIIPVRPLRQPHKVERFHQSSPSRSQLFSHSPHNHSAMAVFIVKMWFIMAQFFYYGSHDPTQLQGKSFLRCWSTHLFFCCFFPVGSVITAIKKKNKKKNTRKVIEPLCTDGISLYWPAYSSDVHLCLRITRAAIWLWRYPLLVLLLQPKARSTPTISSPAHRRCFVNERL